MPAVFALLLSVVLSPPFGAAEATAVSTTGGLTLEVMVEVNAPATAVLVRPVGQGTELPPVALTDQGDGTWAGIVELATVENIQVAFELVPSSGPSTVSEMHTLTELGVDRAVFEPSSSRSASVDEDEDEDAAANRQWVWLALAAGAAGLALLVVWAFWDRDEKSDDEQQGTLDVSSGNTDNSADADRESN
jgi:hypothetical protein